MSQTALRLLTYNIQVAIGSRRYRHYVSHGWKYVMPHGQSLHNLDRIAEVLAPFDIVGLQEADGGSFRTAFVDQARYLAASAGFNSCQSMITRDFGRFAQHTNSLLSRIPVQAVHEHRLPGAMDGRGVLETRFNLDGRPLSVFITHLALRQRTRMRQVAYLAKLVNAVGPSVVMGDFNAKPRSKELKLLCERAGLRLSTRPVHGTLPSWRPRVAVDHILASPEIVLEEYGPLPELLSDHLPVQAVARWKVTADSESPAEVPELEASHPVASPESA
ncbi:endonuclease/exonuclease/phosphatase family protein [Thiohalorhabdus sp. Cl-TMA]|uniref:Endonuclease/exonuclease/phosphatase family protein n=1 Tax=Thiohalorhabdus methylotrophus TaxID=3242694 RepID=A0ABV4TT50_9GAMM